VVISLFSVYLLLILQTPFKFVTVEKSMIGFFSHDRSLELPGQNEFDVRDDLFYGFQPERSV